MLENNDRCEHGTLWYDPPCTLCAEEKAPTSETERLLAGSLAIAELAALRKTLKEYGIWLQLQADDAFLRSHSTNVLPSQNEELWRARGTCYHEAANKLKELLETK